MVSKACMGCKEDPGFQGEKESLERLAFQGQRAQLGCQVAKEAVGNRVPQDRLPAWKKLGNFLKGTKEIKDLWD